jgi:hypothetical protein
MRHLRRTSAVLPGVDLNLQRPFAPLLSRGRPTALGALAALLACSGLAACSDDSAGTGSKTADPAAAVGLPPAQFNAISEVDTTLSETKVKAGTLVGVTCTGMPGSVLIPKPTFVVTPSAGVKIQADGKILPEKTGTYTVACTVSNSKKVVDVTPVQLTVTAGPAATLIASVSPAIVKSGDTADVTCSGVDAYGNAIGKDGEQFSLEVSPAELAKPEAESGGTTQKVSGIKVGKGDVRCKMADALANVQVTPGALEVTAGAAIKTKATVTPGELVAGEGSAEVVCSAEDAAGNPVQSANFTIDPPVGVTLSGTKLSSTKAGSYDITCGLSGVTSKTPGVLKIIPAAPVQFALGIEPKQPVYKQAETVKVMSLEEDKYGNVAKVHVKTGVAVDPPEAVTVNAGGVSFDLALDGYTTFSYTHPTLKTGDGSSTGTVKIKVDSNGPLLYIASPKRGATLNVGSSGGADSTVNVTGTIADELSAVKVFTINKTDVSFKKDGSFSFPIASVQGMNPILWETEDEWGNKRAGVQTYYFSPKWYPGDTAKPAEAMVKSGIGFWMSQSTLDNGPPHKHDKPDDLASVLEIVFGTLDLKGLVGAQGFPINQNLLLMTIKDISIQSVKFGDPKINDGYPELGLTVIKGGIHLAGKLHKLDVVLRLNVETFGAKGYQDFVVTSDWINLESDLMMSLDPLTKKPKTELKNTKIKMQTFKILLGGNSLPAPLDGWVSQGSNFLINIIDSFIGTTFTGLLEGILQDQLQKQLGGALGSAFEGLAINTELPMKPFIGGGEEVKLKLNSALGLLDFKAGEGILVGLDAAMTAPHKVPHQVLGSIGRGGCLVPGSKEIFNPALKYALEVGLADDFVNELLYSLWNGGLLQLKIGAEALGSVDLNQYGVKDLSIETDFLLQPMLNTCLTKDGSLKLQIGDLGIRAKLNFSGTPVDVYMFATLQATAELKAVDNPTTKQKEIGFALKGVDLLELEVTQINAEAASLKDLFATLIKTIMVPKLLESLGNGLGGFPLPELDLSSLSPAIPAGTKFALEIQTITNDGGYTYLRGKIK